MNWNFAFSNTGIFEFIILAALLFLAQLITTKLINIVPLQNRIRKIVKRLVPIIEIVVWAVFFIWASNALFSANMVYTGLLLLVIVVFVLIFARVLATDLIAGIILKTEDSFKLGDLMQFGENKGKITRADYRFLEIETDTGAVVRIPYSKIADSSIVQLNSVEITKISHTMKVSTGKKHSLSVTANLLKTISLNSPYVSVTKKPNIQLVSETDNSFMFDISISTLDIKYIPIIQNYIEEQFEVRI
ncbi:MAG: mechanosensitive ion channel [Candidatus Kapabacteria bacterium]|jgi:small-conductance mechanosensitive channel|nr:mechanosensitive ion channel [Candidatus Kapabacteria bacterium]